MGLLDFIQFIVGCSYISDLKYEPYNFKAKELLKQLKLNNYPLNEIRDTIEYIFFN